MRRQTRIRTIALASGFAGLLAHADDAVRFSGFGTLGVASGDDDTLGFRRDITQDSGAKDHDLRVDVDSLLGLQLDAEPVPKFGVTVQAVLRDRPEQSLDEILQLASLRFRPREGSDFRVGRLALDTFMLSDYRQVGYAYPWVGPNPDFYGIVPYYHLDGVDFTQRFAMGMGELSLKLYGGRSSTHIPILHDPSGNGAFRIDLDQLWGASLLFEQDAWRGRLAYTRVHVDSEPPLDQLLDGMDQAAVVWPEAADFRDRISLRGDVGYATAGISYDDGNWLIQAEFADIDGDDNLTPKLDSGYLSVGRRLHAFTVFGVLSGVKPKDDAEQVALPSSLPPGLQQLLEPLRAGVQTALNSSRADQRGEAVGVRWDFAPHKALKLQWNHWRVEPEGGLLWTDTIPDGAGSRSVNVITASLDFVF